MLEQAVSRPTIRGMTIINRKEFKSSFLLCADFLILILSPHTLITQLYFKMNANDESQNKVDKPTSGGYDLPTKVVLAHFWWLNDSFIVSARDTLAREYFL